MMEIKDHVARAQIEPSDANIEALWRAVFELQVWYLLPSEVEGPSTPMVLVIDEEPWLVVFTNFRRLREFLETQDLLGGRRDVPMIILNPLEAMMKIREHSKFIKGVVYNPLTEERFRAPVTALDQYAAHFGFTS